MIADPDPAAVLADAQRRYRRRALVVASVAVLGLLVGAALVLHANRPGPLFPPIARPFLWKVEAPSGGEPSYLFGTIHVGYAVDDLPAAVLAAQARSRITVVESDLASDDAGETDATGEPPSAPAHRGRDRLSPAQWKELARVTHVDEETLVEADSWPIVAAVLRSDGVMREPMDDGLQRRGIELGHELVFLETRSYEEVNEAATGERTSEQSLQVALEHPRALRAAVRHQVRRYARGADGACVDSSGIDDLIDHLNDTWAPGIEAQVARGGAFVAIGCSHLDGPGSIVERLRAAGYRVERIP